MNSSVEEPPHCAAATGLRRLLRPGQRTWAASLASGAVLAAASVAAMAAPASGAAATTAVVTAPASHPDPTLTLITSDHHVTAPCTVRAGTMFVDVVNTGHEVHIGVMFRLSTGKTLADFRALLRHPPQQQPAWVHPVDFDGLSPLSPGHRMSILADLEHPGTYVYFDQLPTPSGLPHALAGEMTSFQVTAPEQPEIHPGYNATITAKDTRFEIPPLTAAMRTLRLVNHGRQAHEFAIIRLRPHATLGQASTWLADGQTGPAPATFFGGVQDVEPGGTAFITILLRPGRYLLVDGETGVSTPFEVRP
jgi:hypothetical protein